MLILELRHFRINVKMKSAKMDFFHNSITLLSLCIMKNGVTQSKSPCAEFFYRKNDFGVTNTDFINICGGAFLP